MTHRATPRFWSCHGRLPAEVQRLADACHEMLRRHPHHPSLQLKKVGRFWSVRISLHYRALAIEQSGDLIWFWIRTHSEYDGLLGRR